MTICGGVISVSGRLATRVARPLAQTVLLLNLSERAFARSAELNASRWARILDRARSLRAHDPFIHLVSLSFFARSPARFHFPFIFLYEFPLPTHPNSSIHSFILFNASFVCIQLESEFWSHLWASGWVTARSWSLEWRLAGCAAPDPAARVARPSDSAAVQHNGIRYINTRSKSSSSSRSSSRSLGENMINIINKYEWASQSKVSLSPLVCSRLGVELRYEIMSLIHRVSESRDISLLILLLLSHQHPATRIKRRNQLRTLAVRVAPFARQVHMQWQAIFAARFALLTRPAR